MDYHSTQAWLSPCRSLSCLPHIATLLQWTACGLFQKSHCICPTTHNQRKITVFTMIEPTLGHIFSSHSRFFSSALRHSCLSFVYLYIYFNVECDSRSSTTWRSYILYIYMSICHICIWMWVPAYVFGMCARFDCAQKSYVRMYIVFILCIVGNDSVSQLMFLLSISPKPVSNKKKAMPILSIFIRMIFKIHAFHL